MKECVEVKGWRLVLSSRSEGMFFASPHPEEVLPKWARPEFLRVPLLGTVIPEEDGTWSYRRCAIFVGDVTNGIGQDYATRYAALSGLVEAWEQYMRGDFPGKGLEPRMIKIKVVGEDK